MVLFVSDVGVVIVLCCCRVVVNSTTRSSTTHDLKSYGESLLILKLLLVNCCLCVLVIPAVHCSHCILLFFLKCFNVITFIGFNFQ